MVTRICRDGDGQRSQNAGLGCRIGYGGPPGGYGGMHGSLCPNRCFSCGGGDWRSCFRWIPTTRKFNTV
ncbi:hypothetical protein TSUD_329360 [Trifolium subterraneum]|uniref:Uncharacterized protein n=1 Tax=Trifolium subterraneum TaxID=3900 RepID=A0A2Z6NEH2_TRISU|nr:hypothetical protein TSUD_329360 [Trifolium subterraneum]